VKPGAILSRPVYDSRGKMVFDSGDRITDASLTTLKVYGVSEVLVEDSRLADVLVQPTFPPEVEAEATQALRQLIDECWASKSIDPSILQQVTKPIFSMTRRLYPEVIGEPNVAGCQFPADYHYVQPVKVAGMSLLMARMTGRPMLKLAHAGLAAVLMNIGYMKLPQEILQKLGELTEDESEDIRRHAQSGHEMVSRLERFDAEAAQAILQHHERWDGSGYPAGLKGSDISLLARIVGIADTYYALVSSRPYGKALMPHEAIEYIMAFGGDLFDPELVRIFARQVPLYPTGVTVKLNTGQIGVVSDANIGHVGRPIIRILYNKDGEEEAHPHDIDLAKAEHQSILVVQTLEY